MSPPKAIVSPRNAKEDLATLEIPLVNDIAADLLADLLGSLGALYFFELWLDLAAQSRTPSTFPDQYSQTAAETLWITSLEIGSPNRVRLTGRRKHILALAGFLGSLLAVPKGIVDVNKGLAEARQIRVETELKRLEIEEKRLDILSKAQALYENRRISENALKHKQQDYPQALERLRTGLSVVAPERTITVSRE